MRDDKYLMPPPLTTHIKKAAGVGESTSPTKEISSPGSSPTKSPPQSTDGLSASEKKLETPLAAMMPSKYEGVNVSEIFPEFRRGKVLRWSRLFLPGKPNSLPQIWKNVKRRRRKRKILAEGQAAADAADEADREKRGWAFQYADDDDVSSSIMGSDDEEEFLCSSLEKPKNDNQRNHNLEGRSIMSSNPNIWRHGPAELWFDMLNVPEDGDGFDYGLPINMRSSNGDREDSSSDDDDNHRQKENSMLAGASSYPGESYHMLTQRDWETDIVWDGSDTKYKKLTKNAAAGWVPSGVNRTAQNFSQPGVKGPPGPPPTPTPPNVTGSGKKDKEGKISGHYS